ncbi:MAG: HAD family hydrolase [Parachlamydiales bacterium]|nr:HAD family hydrolase [Parachlamydiales bacterium]
MLIIFDLDDTLIDTSGSVTPYKLKECLKGFVALGLKVADFETALKRLTDINEKASGSKEALAKFLNESGGDSGLLPNAIREMTRPLPSDFVISTTPNAKEILQIFAQKHTLALVTGGHPPFQLEKLEKAGIDRAFFSKIAIPEDSVKKPFYEDLIREFSIHPREVLVCGDRIAMDLAPAHALGCQTVHMRWGRGTKLETEKWINHSISNLSELKRIVKI